MVSVGPPDGGPHMVYANGTLQAGREIDPPEGANDTIYFNFEEDSGSGFFINQRTFESASVEGPSISIIAGGLAIDVGPAPPVE